MPVYTLIDHATGEMTLLSCATSDLEANLKNRPPCDAVLGPRDPAVWQAEGAPDTGYSFVRKSRYADQADDAPKPNLPPPVDDDPSSGGAITQDDAPGPRAL